MKEPVFPEEYDNNNVQDPILPSNEEVLNEDFLAELLDEDDGAFIKGPGEVMIENVITEADLAEEIPVHENLTDPNTREELAAADHAMYSAGLQHPEDAEFRFEEENFPVEALINEETPVVEEVAQAEASPVVPEAVPQQVKEPAPERKDRPVRKGRPKRRKGPGLLGIPHLLSALVWLMIIVAIGTTLGRILWVCAADVLAFGREDKDVTISVTTEDTMESIAQKLHNAGLVRYPELF